MADGSRLHRRHAALAASASNDANGDISSRRGDLAMAIPHHRSMYLTSFIMRVVSATISATIIGVIASSDGFFYWEDHLTVYWAYGAPTAGMALLWCLIDITVLLIKDRGLAWRQSDRRQKRRRRSPGSAFCWGRPGAHMCVHLVIWLVSLVLGALLWMNWFMALEGDRWGAWDPIDIGENGTVSAETHIETNDAKRLWIVPTLQIPLTFIHFVLFVLACIATDDRIRGYSDIVFVPKDNGTGDIVTALPSSLWSLFTPLRLPSAVSVNQYVRFVPVEDGTVRVARDSGQREP